MIEGVPAQLDKGVGATLRSRPRICRINCPGFNRSPKRCQYRCPAAGVELTVDADHAVEGARGEQEAAGCLASWAAATCSGS